MLRLALSNLRANAGRFVATAVAVVAGVAFLAAGLIVTDAVREALLGSVARQYAGVDLAVVSNDLLDMLGSNLGGPSATVLGADSLAKVRAVPGVAAAAPEQSVEVKVLRPSGDAVSVRTRGRPWITDDALNPLQITDGRAPRRPGEVVVDRGLASRAGLRTGSTAALATPAGPRRATVVGLSAFDRDDAVDPGGTVSFSESEAGTVLGGGTVSWTRILVRARGPAAPVGDAVQSALGSQVAVVTAQSIVDDSQRTSSVFIALLRPVLQGFALLSLFVCGFVIFNTFSVVVTQRFRELALVRAVGGTPAQVRRSLLVEGLAVGLLASAAGVLVGGLGARGLQSLLAALDLRLPGNGIKVTTGTVVACLVTGTVVTLASVAVPAIRAGRTRPVEAMRRSAVDRSGSSVLRLLAGGAALVGGTALLLGAKAKLVPGWTLGLGTWLLFAGVVVGGPLVARAFSRLVGLPMRAFGLTGRLAADNCARNPRRTATTANALVIGLFLVTLVTVAGSAVKGWAINSLNSLSGSDYIVGSDGAVPDAIVAGIARAPGVAGSAPVRLAALQDPASGPQIVSTTDVRQLERTAGVKVSSGSLDGVTSGAGLAAVDVSKVFRDVLSRTGVTTTTVPGYTDPTDGALSGPTFGPDPPEVGTTVEITGRNGPERLEVAAVLEAKLDALALGLVVGPATFERLVGPQPVRAVFVRAAPGQVEQVGLELERLTRGYTTIDVQPGNFIGQAVGRVLDFLIGAVNLLLAMSLVVALIGIVNTMTLSILERRQELGMVRALGMTRGQVGAMVGLEALLLGLLGTLVGVGSGLFVGWVLIGRLDGSIDLGVDWGRVGLIALAGLGAGLLAAVLPTRRATKVAVLDAIATG